MSSGHRRYLFVRFLFRPEIDLYVILIPPQKGLLSSNVGGGTFKITLRSCSRGG